MMNDLPESARQAFFPARVNLESGGLSLLILADVNGLEWTSLV